MNQEAFVDSVRRCARDAAIDGVLRILERPPGRSPAPELVDASGWYERLAPDDRERVRHVVALTADHVVFGLFAVLDGARPVEDSVGPKGRFELRHVSASGEVTALAGEGTAPLHELLDAVTEASTTKIEVELVGDAVNAAVVKLPWRRFPAVLLQGDSLGNLTATAERLVAALAEGRTGDAGEEASEVRDLLNGYKRAYEHAMGQAGLELPYSSAP